MSMTPPDTLVLIIMAAALGAGIATTLIAVLGSGVIYYLTRPIGFKRLALYILASIVIAIILSIIIRLLPGLATNPAAENEILAFNMMVKSFAYTASPGFGCFIISLGHLFFLKETPLSRLTIEKKN